MERKIDQCLSVRDGHLFIEECDAVKLVGQFGSPIYVVSEDQLRRNVRRFQKAFGDRWPEGSVNILPAIKSNWLLAVRQILTEEGAGCDVFSEGELYSALKSGIKPALVSVNGGGKSQQHIRDCINAGVRITVDDIDELDVIRKVADGLGKKAFIRFRLRPEVPNHWQPTGFAVEPVAIDLGVQVYKSGIPTEHVVDLGLRALKMKNVQLVGFHLHLGRHHGSVGYFQGTMERYVKLIAFLKEQWGGYEPTEIDIGGGFPSPRDPFGRVASRMDMPLFALFLPITWGLKIFGEKIRYKIISVAMEAFMKKEPNRRLSPAIEQYAEAITVTLRREFKKVNIDPKGMTLQVEPGRSLYGDTAVHLTRVLKTKYQTKPIKMNWVLLDTTYFFMAGGVFENNLYDFLVANDADRKPVKNADVCGKSCFADRLLPEVRIPDVEPGDIFAILDTGAYQEVSASNFNALPRPATILVHGDQAEVIKRAETIQDIFRRDVVPKRLLKK